MTNIFVMLSKYVGSNAVTWVSTLISSKHSEIALLGFCRCWESLQRLCWALEIVAYCFSTTTTTTTTKYTILSRLLRIWGIWREALRWFRDTAKASQVSKKTNLSWGNHKGYLQKLNVCSRHLGKKYNESFKCLGKNVDLDFIWSIRIKVHISLLE